MDDLPPGDEHAARILDSYRDRYGTPFAIGHSWVAHRELGYCAACVPRKEEDPGIGASMEVTGWRLLAMASNGIPPPPAARWPGSPPPYGRG